MRWFRCQTERRHGNETPRYGYSQWQHSLSPSIYPQASVSTDNHPLHNLSLHHFLYLFIYFLLYSFYLCLSLIWFMFSFSSSSLLCCSFLRFFPCVSHSLLLFVFNPSLVAFNVVASNSFIISFLPIILYPFICLFLYIFLFLCFLHSRVLLFPCFSFICIPLFTFLQQAFFWFTSIFPGKILCVGCHVCHLTSHPQLSAKH